MFDAGTFIGLNYTPPENVNNTFAGLDSFSYTVRDESTTGGETFSLAANALIPDRLTATNVVFLDLSAVNDRPVFEVTVPSVEVSEDSTEVVLPNYAFNISAGPLATAFDEIDVRSGQSVQFSVTPLDFTPAEAGDFFLTAPVIDATTGDLTFQPAPDVFGSYSFEIMLVDDGPGTADGGTARGDITHSLPRTLTIDVQPVNDPPVVNPAASELRFSLLEDGTFEILVEGDNTNPGLIDVFLPGPTSGPGDESADIAPRVGANQSLSLGEPVPATSANGGTIEAINDPVTGEVSKLIYTPRADFVGTDSFIYTVTDDGVTVPINRNGEVNPDPRIASSTVTFEVLPVNDAPQFSGAANVQTTEDAGVVVIDSWANNVQVGPLTAVDEVQGNLTTVRQVPTFVFRQLSSNPELFTVPPSATIVGDTASLSFQSAPDANGTALFEVFLRDNGPQDASIGDEFESAATTFAINVEPVNDAPSFTPGSNVTVNEDSGPYSEQWATDISPGPNDERSQSVQFLVTTPAEFQSLFLNQPTINEDGVLRFTPASNANTNNPVGPALVEVTAIDTDGGQADTFTLVITINEVNDVPQAVSDLISTDEDTVLTIPASQLISNDLDPDLATNAAEQLTVVMPLRSFSVSGAEVAYDPVSGEIQYDPSSASALQELSPNQFVSDSFSYAVRDAAGALSGLVTVGLTVSGVNDAPVVGDDLVALNPVGPTEIFPLNNDIELDRDGFIVTNSIRITLQPAFGALDIDVDGKITYTPFVTFAEEDQFRYVVQDNLGLSSGQALVTVAANAGPAAMDDAVVTFLDEAVDIDVAANDADPDGDLDLTSVRITRQPARGEAIPAGNGRIQYVPEPGFLGRDFFEYTISDQEGRISNVARVDTQVVASRLQNPELEPDVNDNGFVTALDALLIINHIARFPGTNSIPVVSTDVGPNFYDVNGNQLITAGDALLVINAIGESRAVAEQVVPDQALVTLPASRQAEPESVSPEAAPIVAAVDTLKAVDADLPVPVAAELIDLIALDREEESDDDAIAALDAAMAEVL